MPNLSGGLGDCSPARTGCASVALLHGGDPSGTAASMTSWLLVEQPGPWPADALERYLAEVIDEDRMAKLREAGLRPLLIRRPGRHARSTDSSRAVFVGSGRPGERWLERIDVADAAELAKVDLEAVARGESGHGQAVTSPMLLVCTHGAKDMCCAVRGRPLATALADDYPGLAWEVSHVGGDRWAGNLLVVPDGYLHGQLEPAKAALVAKAAMAGQVHPDYLRGRTTATTSWEQVAEIAVRRHTGFTGVDDVLAVGARAGDSQDEQTVLVAAHEQRYEVRMRRQRTSSSTGSRCAERLKLVTHPVIELRRLGDRQDRALGG